MKRTKIALVLISIMISIPIFALPIKTQEPLYLTIKPDGSVEPSTNLLEQKWNTYTLKGDIFGTITVQIGGITIDGAGHVLQGRGIDEERGINLGASHLVLVENLRIYDGVIFTVGSSNCSFIGNYFDHSSLEIVGFANYTGNLIKYNTFRNASIFYDYNKCGMDVITENTFVYGDFIKSGIFVGLAPAPIVDKNYWSNYAAKYSNAKELGNSGIWDTPYVDDAFAGYSNTNCVDYHPLVNPITDFEIPEFNNLNLPTSNPTTSTFTIYPTAFSTIDSGYQLNQTFLSVIVSVIVVAIVALVSLVYLKKHRRITNSNSYMLTIFMFLEARYCKCLTLCSDFLATLLYQF